MTRKVKSRALGRDVDELLAAGRKATNAGGTATASAPEVLPAAPERVENGLGGALGFPGANGIPGITGSGDTQPVSDSATIFDSLRWFLVSNLRQVLSQAYVEIGLIRTAVDTPVNDALRGGVEIKSKQLSEQEIELLKHESKRAGDLRVVGQGAKWNRLFGGAGLIILTDQDPSTPLDMDAIGEDTPLEFRAAELWELFWSKQNEALESEKSLQLDRDDLGEEVEPLEEPDGAHYDYYGHKVHKSRVLKMVGIEPPSYVKPRMRGWGVSIVEAFIRSVNQYLKATGLAFEVLDEFKLDIYKIKGLAATLMSPNGQQVIAQRVQLANWQKNFQNGIVMDSEDDHDYKQLSFTGLSEVMIGIKQQVASDLRFPMTKLFGISAAGFSSGEDDIEVYNGMVESEVREPIHRDVLRVYQLRCQQLFGYVPDDLEITFKPLRVLSAVDEESVKTQKFARAMQAKQAGELTTKEFRDICNKGNLFDVYLDADDATIGEIEDEQDEKAALAAGGGEGDSEDAKPKTSPTDKTGGKAKPAGKPAKPVKNGLQFLGRRPA